MSVFTESVTVADGKVSAKGPWALIALPCVILALAFAWVALALRLIVFALVEAVRLIWQSGLFVFGAFGRFAYGLGRQTKGDGDV